MHRHSFLTPQRAEGTGHRLKLPEETKGERALLGEGNRPTGASISLAAAEWF